MGWALGIAVYFVIWWVLLFAVLPFGVRSQHESQEIVPGTEPGAPTIPYLGRKLLANTILSALIWIAVDVAYIQLYLNR